MNDKEKENKQKIEKIKRLYKLYNLDPHFLCCYIILYKTLGMHKDLAMDAMEVLYYRVNILKENFDYNKFISEKIKTIPVLPEISKQSSQLINNINIFTKSSLPKK